MCLGVLAQFLVVRTPPLFLGVRALCEVPPRVCECSQVWWFHPNFNVCKQPPQFLGWNLNLKLWLFASDWGEAHPLHRVGAGQTTSEVCDPMRLHRFGHCVDTYVPTVILFVVLQTQTRLPLQSASANRIGCEILIRQRTAGLHTSRPLCQTTLVAKALAAQLHHGAQPTYWTHSSYATLPRSGESLPIRHHGCTVPNTSCY